MSNPWESWQSVIGDLAGLVGHVSAMDRLVYAVAEASDASVRRRHTVRLLEDRTVPTPIETELSIAKNRIEMLVHAIEQAVRGEAFKKRTPGGPLGVISQTIAVAVREAREFLDRPKVEDCSPVELSKLNIKMEGMARVVLLHEQAAQALRDAWEPTVYNRKIADAYAQGDRSLVPLINMLVAERDVALHESILLRAARIAERNAADRLVGATGK